MEPQYSHSLLPDSFSKGCPSSSVTALRQSTRFLVRQARCPNLHLASALSFSVCVQDRFALSASRSARFPRVRIAMIWLSFWKSIHSNHISSKQFPIGIHASQHRMSVPSCLFLYARSAVVAINSFAPTLSGVLRESSRTVCLLAFPMIALNSASARNGLVGYWWSSQSRFKMEQKTGCFDIQLGMRSLC